MHPETEEAPEGDRGVPPGSVWARRAQRESSLTLRGPSVKQGLSAAW